MIRWGVMVVLGLAGCHGILGVEETVRGNDSDRDGINDDVDNCVGLANQDQTDTDGDGIGDACDNLICVIGTRLHSDANSDGVDDGCECDASSAEDEDSDGVPDTCDVCPGVDDPSQEDLTDMDRVGNACDLLPDAPQQRRAFDAFTPDGEVTNGTWLKVPGWLKANGAIGLVMTSDDLLLQDPLVGEDSGDWSVTVGILLPTGIGIVDRFLGLSLRIAVDDASPALCMLQFLVDGSPSGASWYLIAKPRVGNVATPAQLESITGIVPLRMSIHDRGGTIGFRCEVLGNSKLIDIDDPSARGTVFVGLHTDFVQASLFTYADVIVP